MSCCRFCVGALEARRSSVGSHQFSFALMSVLSAAPGLHMPAMAVASWGQLRQPPTSHARQISLHPPRSHPPPEFVCCGLRKRNVAAFVK